jgi:hypothetical protein
MHTCAPTSETAICQSGINFVGTTFIQLVGSCSQEDFQVQAVFLVCDSPGAYYRGSSTYRDSTTCTYGDKAHLQLQCK